jgi:hypothetical protein
MAFGRKHSRHANYRGLRRRCFCRGCVQFVSTWSSAYLVCLELGSGRNEIGWQPAIPDFNRTEPAAAPAT